MEEKVFDVAHAAAYTGLKKATIYAYAEKKRIPHLKVGSRLLFQRDDLDTWLNGHRIEVIGPDVYGTAGGIDAG